MGKSVEISLGLMEGESVGGVDGRAEGEIVGLGPVGLSLGVGLSTLLGAVEQTPQRTGQ
jgi:hypothetical protein